MPEQEPKYLTDEELKRLRTAEPEPELVAIVRRDPEAIGETRNSARELVRTHLRGEPDLSDLGLRNRLETGGHFFGALLDGNLGEAFIRADVSNVRLVLDTFEPAYIEECLIHEEDFSPEKAKRYLGERIKLYGDKLDL